MSFENTEVDISSVDDYDSLDELDFQSDWSNFDELQAAKSYWLGKKVFEFAQAYMICTNSSVSESVTEVDVCMFVLYRETSSNILKLRSDLKRR